MVIGFRDEGEVWGVEWLLVLGMKGRCGVWSRACGLGVRVGPLRHLGRGKRIKVLSSDCIQL